MSKSRSAVTGLLAIVFLFNMGADVLGSSLVIWRRSTMAEVTQMSQAVSGPSIALRSGSGSAIEFRTQNGKTLNNVPSQVSDLPHLVLYRNGALTDRNERTLIVEVNGIVVPPAGAKVTLRMETQHAEPSAGADRSNRIRVWHESKSLTNTLGFTQTGVSVMFVHEFEETVATETDTLPTPTDYFRYEIKVAGASDATTDGWHVFTEDYAVLLENQWIEELPEVQEESPGAAPRELIVYFCDMFPFRSKEQQLDRENVPGYVQAELAPAMASAFHTQTDSWAMGPWYDKWASFRGEKRLSVALAAPGIWYHGRALNHSGITLLTYDDNPVGFQYDRLIDEHLSSFHHELFHNLQLNIGLHAGSRNFANWKFFTEGQAVMASSVGPTIT